MKFNDELGKDYLKLRQASLDLGVSKSSVIPYALNYIDELSQKKSTVRIADFGCSEGSMISKLAEYSRVSNVEYYGFDFNESVIKIARKKYKHINFEARDLYKDDMSDLEDKFDIIFATNTFHEVFSLYGWNGKFSRSKALSALNITLSHVISTLVKNGVFILFDGVEHSLPRKKEIQIELKNKTVEKNLKKFIKEYKPINMNFKKEKKLIYSTDIESITRFITKYRFLNSSTWKLEQFESYQFYSQREYIRKFSELGLHLETMNLLAPNIEKWSKILKIKTEKVFFPFEHILIVGRKVS